MSPPLPIAMGDHGLGARQRAQSRVRVGQVGSTHGCAGVGVLGEPFPPRDAPMGVLGKAQCWESPREALGGAQCWGPPLSPLCPQEDSGLLCWVSSSTRCGRRVVGG